MLRKSRLLTLISTSALAIALINPLSPAHAATSASVSEGIKVALNGNEFKPKSAPFFENGAVYLPVRDMGELLGTLVSWNSSSKTVTMNYPELTVKVSYGSTSATVNGKTIALSAPLRMVEGRIYVPLRFLSESTGADVKWEASRKTVNITRSDNFVKEYPTGMIWLNRQTGDIYKARDDQSPAVRIGKLDAALKGSISFYGSLSGGNSVLTIVDNYGEPGVHYDAYSLLVLNNKIVNQRKASYFQRYEQNASYYQIYNPDGWLQYLTLTDGKTVTVFDEQGKEVKEYDLPALAGKDDVYTVHAIGEDYLVVRPNGTGLLTLIDFKDNSIVTLADKLLTGKDLEYARTNDVPYRGDELRFGADMGHGTLDFFYNSPIDGSNGNYVRLSYDRPSYKEERDALPKNRSISELASVCKPETVDSIYMKDGDMVYLPLVGANKDDRDGINAFCGILKKFAAKGVQETVPEVVRDTFFHGMSITFTEGDYLDLFHVPQGLAIDQGRGKRLVLTDKQAARDFDQLKVAPAPMSVTPNPARFGETVHIKGTTYDFGKETSPVSVYWTPSSSNSKDKSLLIATGTAKFGRYDFKFKMPAYGKASDGTMKPLQLGKGMIDVNNLFEIELLPASKIFLSVNGVPVADPSFDPITAGGRTYVPLRAIASITGESVAWDAKTRSVLIRTNPSAVKGHPDGVADLWIDGKMTVPDLRPIIRAGTAYVPIRAVTAAFGLPVTWDNVSRSVNVTLAPPTKAGQ